MITEQQAIAADFQISMEGSTIEAEAQKLGVKPDELKQAISKINWQSESIDELPKNNFDDDLPH